jgi:hypothetical protein
MKNICNENKGEFFTSNDKPCTVAYRYNIEASIYALLRHAQAVEKKVKCPSSVRQAQ